MNGNLNITIEIEKEKYMKSKLFEYVDKNKLKKEFSKLLHTNSSPTSSINILVYENDKDNPGKKTKKSKIYAGYLVFIFKTYNKLVYKLQIENLLTYPEVLKKVKNSEHELHGWYYQIEVHL